MQSISAAFQTALATGHRQVITANVLSGGGVVVRAGVKVTDGGVTIARSAAQRRVFKATLALDDLTLIPTLYTDNLMPFGNEIALTYGWIDPATGNPYIIPATGLVEATPLGVFAFTTNTITDSGSDLTMTVSGYDRSWSLSQRAFLTAYTVAAGTAPETAIQAILTAQYPAAPPLNWGPPSGFALPLLNFAPGDDPMAACLSMADSAGYEFFFNAQGVPCGLPVPPPASQPTVWTYAADGTGNARPMIVQRVLTRDGVSNDYTMSGTGSQNVPPVSANASDTSPTSPTYTGGAYGDIPVFQSSSGAITTAACQGGATLALATALGQIDQYVVTVPPAPMFDIDDIVALTVPRLNLTAKATVVDGVTLSLRYDTPTVLNSRAVIA